MPIPLPPRIGQICEMVKEQETNRGTMRKFIFEDCTEKHPQKCQVTAFGKVGARMLRSIGREVQLVCRLDRREWEGKHFLDMVVDGVFDAAGIEPPSIPAEERSGPAADQVPAMPDFRPPSVRNAQPEQQAAPPKTYGQPPAEEDDIPF